MGTVIVAVLLAAVVFFAVRSSLPHFRGEGGCCGGGCGEKAEKKRLNGEITAKKIIQIEGMHCAHCKNSVETQINQIEGAAGRVNLKKHMAVVSMERMVSDEELTQAVERAGFTVSGITVR